MALRDRPSTANLQPLLDQIAIAGKLTRQEYMQLATLILSDYSVNEEDRRQINRIFDEVQTGKLKLAK
jgi:hypothetical protein